MMPPRTLLDGATAKVERAEHHIADFKREIEGPVQTALGKSVNDFIAHEDDPQRQQRRYILIREPEVPRWPMLIAGDALTNLQSALDFMAFVGCGRRLPSDQRKLQNIAFPIAGSTKDFPARLGGTIQPFVEPAFLKAVCEIEPYKGGKGEVLWQIAALNRIQKHRLLPALFCTNAGVMPGPDRLKKIAASDPVLGRQIEGMDDVPLFIPFEMRPLRVGEVLFFEPLDDTSHQPVQFAFQIALDEPDVTGVCPLLEELQEMAVAVRGAIEALTKVV